MTVASNTTRNDYVAGSSQSVYAYTFQLNEAGDVDVYLDGDLQTLNTHYTVENLGVGTGGTITFTLVDGENNPIHPPQGAVINFVMAMELDRDTDYQPSGAFLAQDVNNDYDRLWLAANQQQTAINRSLRLQDDDVTTGSMELPTKDQRKGKLLGFDAVTGDPVTTSSFDTSSFMLRANNLSDVASAATSRSNLGLGTAATTQSSDYATAAQGAKADAALPTSGGALTGPVTTTSTIDGRDISVDGAKLDGIEAGATADQTAGEIKTAYESNANTNAYTDAEKSKLAGVEANANNYTLPFADNSANWNTAYGWGDHSLVGYTTGNDTITLSGDVSGSGTTSIVVTIADDSHNHVISNVDGLQSALDGKVDDAQVLTNVPAGAVFTDTTYSAGTGVSLVGTTFNIGQDVATTSGVTFGAVTVTGNLSVGSSLFSDDITATNIQASGNLAVSGDLTVNGTTTTLNTANLDVEDKNITLNYGVGDTSASANGAGITIQDAVNSTTDATILWDATNDEFDFSHDVTAPNLNVTNWNTAYSWGDHAAAGYLTSFTETDPTVPAHVKAISTTNISNWNTAYGWGDHAAAGYLPSASYTAADVLTKIKTVDGSGSGLDADLLDGVHGSSFLRSDVSATNSVDLRAPIFYDSGNTGNYLDSPTSSVFRLNGSTAVNLAVGGATKLAADASGIDVTGNLEMGATTVIDSSRNLTNVNSLSFSDTSPTLSENVNYLRIQTASGYTDIGSANSTWAHFFTDRSGFYFGSRINVNGEIRVYNTASVINSTGAYAPAFYDSDDTAFYVNPASTSQVLTLTATGQINADKESTTSVLNSTIRSKGSVVTTTGYNPQNYHIAFENGAGVIKGSISSSHYATIYSTSSDYRLKEDIQPITNATERLLKLKPVNFKWIDGQQRSDGFIAHELQEHLPEAVTGEKDAVDEDGNIELQGIDQSKIVPLLVKTIQELEARLAALENA